MMRRLVLLVALVTIACRGKQMPAPHTPESRPSPNPGALQVGVSRVDVTPLPTVSLFGHGPGARVAEGYWSRLFCRSYYIAPGENEEDALALVACDLSFISTLLQRQVSQALQCAVKPPRSWHEAKKTCGDLWAASRNYLFAPDDDACDPFSVINDMPDRAERAHHFRCRGRTHPIPPSRLNMSATHTHAGPAHYFDTKNLSSMFSSNFPGFDKEMLNFLAVRIAQGLLDAQGSAVPAEMRWVRGHLWGLKQNVSVAAYQLNPEDSRPWYVDYGTRKLGATAEGVDAVDRPLSRALLVADPTLRTVEFRTRSASPEFIGSISYYAEHPTVIGNRNQLLGGDVFGAAARTLERMATEPGERSPVMAIVNTNQGDAHPVRIRGDISNVLDVARTLAKAIWKLHRTPELATDHPGCQSETTPPESLNHRWERFPPTSQPAYFCVSKAEPWKSTAVVTHSYGEATVSEARQKVNEQWQPILCPTAMMGRRAGRGNATNPTVMATLIPDPRLDTSDHRTCDSEPCHAPKAFLLPWVAAPMQGRKNFSEVLPLALVRLGSTLISHVPGEYTMTAGHAINESVLAASRNWPKERGEPPTDAVIAGLSNSYIQYVTTMEEYGLQLYQGASTLWGPKSAEYFRLAFECLSEEMNPAGRCAESRGLFGWLDDKDMGFGVASDFRYKNGSSVGRFPRRRERGKEGAARVHQCKIRAVAPDDPPSYCLVWLDQSPEQTRVLFHPWVELMEEVDGKWQRAGDDDGGLGFETRVNARQWNEELGSNMWVWSTVYTPDSMFWKSGHDWHEEKNLLSVNTGDAEPIASVPFSQLPDCSAEYRRTYCIHE